MGELAERFWVAFGVCALVCAGLTVLQRFSRAQGMSQRVEGFAGFQRSYLLVFLLAMVADWLQGPYVYELYSSYGYSNAEIAQLFVCGFLSSMLAGTVVASLGDKFGRRRMCVLYSITYGLGCLTKLVNNFGVLMIGRILSGIATSLLFASFESWMVCEHSKRNFPPDLLSQTFGYATFGNGLSAVIAGLVANFVAKEYGFVAPFVLALAPLTVCGFIVATSWSENYGNQETRTVDVLKNAVKVISGDVRVCALGIGQALYEGAMYTFVFSWTPALEETITMDGTTEDSSSYLGIVFATFMVCMMIGSSLFQFLTPLTERSRPVLPLIVHAIATAANFVAGSVESKTGVLIAFLTFEMTVGMFYPSYGKIKSAVIPEEVRSAVMTMFRVPLNAIVVIVLLKVDALSVTTVLKICSVMHLCALVAYAVFYLNVTSSAPKAYERVNISEIARDTEEDP